MSIQKMKRSESKTKIQKMTRQIKRLRDTEDHSPCIAMHGVSFAQWGANLRAYYVGRCCVVDSTLVSDP